MNISLTSEIVQFVSCPRNPEEVTLNEVERILV
jgi:hypothetical protein